MKVFHPYLSFGRYGCEVKKDVDVNHEKYKNSFFPDFDIKCFCFTKYSDFILCHIGNFRALSLDF